MTTAGPIEVPTDANARASFDAAARIVHPVPRYEGRGIVIAAGGPYLPSAYLAVRLLRHFGCSLPVEIWHAGEGEKEPWVEAAFGPFDARFVDVMNHCPDRPLEQMRGWPIKPAALLHCRFREVMFIDADCFPLRDPTFLFESPEFREHGAIFWPDSKHHKMVPGARIWELTGIEDRGDTEFETGLILIDKERCYAELRLTEWLNARSDYWYEHVLGDKDTFYLAFRKLGRSYVLAPPCRRIPVFATRHFWTDGLPIADHRTGASKYAIPTRFGPFRRYLMPYKWRSRLRNVVDEIFQRFVIENFSLHAAYLCDLARISEAQVR